MDALELGNLIRSLPQYRGLALVALSSLGYRGEARQMGEAGLDGYLVRPVRGAVLAWVLVHAMERVRSGSRRPLVTRHTMAERLHRRSRAKAVSAGHRVLLAEDNDVNQRVARRFLEDMGVEVTLAADGREALERMDKEGPFDLVFMDGQMPGMDGFEATRRIRAMEDPGSPRVPIIAMTAHAMAGDRERCLDAGMDDYLTKPILRQTLRDTLNK